MDSIVRIASCAAAAAAVAPKRTEQCACRKIARSRQVSGSSLAAQVCVPCHHPFRKSGRALRHVLADGDMPNVNAMQGHPMRCRGRNRSAQWRRKVLAATNVGGGGTAAAGQPASDSRRPEPADCAGPSASGIVAGTRRMPIATVSRCTTGRRWGVPCAEPCHSTVGATAARGPPPALDGPVRARRCRARRPAGNAVRAG